VFKEGEKCNFVYVVLEGEFELTKKIRLPRDPMSLINKYLGPDREKCETNLRLDRH
jgi:CRP-like cAMP-binding protein